MVSIKDVPTEKLLYALAINIRKNFQMVKPPIWSRYVKTASRRIAPPDDKDWWYTRAASILRKIYLIIDGTIIKVQFYLLIIQL